MYIGLGIILLMVFLLPFTVRKIEHNLEFFLFAMGFLATIISGEMSLHLMQEILTNKLLYFITIAVFLAGLLFKVLQNRIQGIIDKILKRVPLKVFVFLLIVILGLVSSILTAIIAALLLVEIVNAMPIKRKDKVNLVIIACFSIGLGAALTPIGEPLSTIVVSKLHVDFWYLARSIGIYIILGVVTMGIIGALVTSKVGKFHRTSLKRHEAKAEAEDTNVHYFLDDDEKVETFQEVIFRSFKIFIFIFALELLGAGFKPVIDSYVIGLDSRILYFINMISAVLDNATIAAAEVSIKMSAVQIKAVLLGLMISGGMLIPGNIPNIISAHKLKITSKEWAKLGVPLGMALMIVYFIIIFIV